MELKSRARSYTDMSLQAIAHVIQNGESEQARVSAAFGMLDRGWGKPQQDNTHEIKGEIKVVLRQMLEDDDE
jgi:hypothetical protein